MRNRPVLFFRLFAFVAALALLAVLLRLSSSEDSAGFREGAPGAGGTGSLGVAASASSPGTSPDAASPAPDPAQEPAGGPSPSPDWDAEAFREWLHSPWPEYAGAAGENPAADDSGEEPADYEGDAPPELSDLQSRLSPRAAFAWQVRRLRDAEGADPEALGRRMLAFDDPTLRALGGVLLVDAEALDADTAAAVAADPNPFVPLIVAERELDYRGPGAAAPLLEALRARRLSEAALREAAESPEGMQGGGRTALALMLEARDGDGRAELCLEAARNAALPYDVRMDAVFRLAEALPETEALARVEDLLAEAGDPSEDLWAEALLRTSERLGRNAPIEEDLAPRPDEPDAPEEGVDVPPPSATGDLSLEELGWFLSDANETSAEDTALRLSRWLADAGVDAVAEAGCADMVLAFVEEFPERQFSPVLGAEEPLERLRALAERIRAREPARAAR